MAQMRSLRRSVAFAAIVGGICAFAGFAAAGHATTSAKEIRVVTGFQFITVVGTVEPVAVGTQGQRELKCPAQYPVLVTGGFRAGGTFSK